MILAYLFIKKPLHWEAKWFIFSYMILQMFLFSDTNTCLIYVSFVN